MDNYLPKQCEDKPFKPFGDFKSFIPTVWETISISLLVLSISFLDKNFPPYICIICFLLALTSESLLKLYCIKLMKLSDSKFYNLIELNKNNVIDSIQNFEKFKKGLFLNPASFTLQIIISIMIVLVCLLNDTRNILICIVPMICAITEIMIIKPQINKMIYKIDRLEKKLLVDDISNKDLSRKVASINKLGYKVGFINVMSKLLWSLIYIFTSGLVMAYSGITSLPYIVFYFAIQLALFDSFKQILNYHEKNWEFDKYKAIISNLINCSKK